ncbi:MAG: hypothetical protein GZ087_05625 [Flavobacterium sp.]|nr:hypothetical protein [Flavobacterium sp.]
MKTLAKNLLNIPFFVFFLFFLVPFMTNAQVGIGTTDPKSTFEVNGSFGQKINTITANTTLNDTYGIVICNNSLTAITVTLPDVTFCTGRVYTIKRNATSTAIVTIAGTIDGVTNLILKDANDSATLFSNGTEWKAVSNSNSSWNVKGNTGTSSTTNYIGTADATDLVLKTNAISRVNITSAGVTTIGGATDRTKFEADGTIVLEGAATVWDDFLVNPDATSRGGSNVPVWGGIGATAFKKNGSSQGVFLWMFSASTEQEVYFTVQLPHKYKVGTNLLPHVHWTTATGIPTGTNVVWGLEYTVIAIGGAFPTTSTLTANSVIGSIGTPTGTGQHLITSLGSINGSGIDISTILICRL